MAGPTSNMTRRMLISRGALALVAAVLPVARLRAEVSPVMEALSRYMAARFMTPPANSSSINAQQHPTHESAKLAGSAKNPGIARHT